LIFAPISDYLQKEYTMKGNKMTTVIVNYSFPKKMSRSETLERFKQAAETFVGMDGLNSKQFIYDELSGKCFSVYNWESREKAEALFNDDFIADFERIVGTTPTFKMHDCLVMVDNRADDVVVWE